MTEQQKIWAEARGRLVSSIAAIGYPEELADLLAEQLKSPRAMDRMTAWLNRVRPGSVEMIADEMLAICAETETWRKKKEGQEAQAGYSAWLNSEARRERAEED